MAAAAPNRVVCPRCSANNFDTQAACWKCGAPLTGSPAPSLRPGAVAPQQPGVSPASYAPGRGADVPYPAVPAGGFVDPSVAIWATVAFAVLFPYFAVIAGLIFLMLDDRRKMEIGRLAIILGLVLSIVHTLITYWMVQGTIKEAVSISSKLGSAMGRAGAASGASSSEPQKLTDPVTFPTP